MLVGAATHTMSKSTSVASLLFKNKILDNCVTMVKQK